MRDTTTTSVLLGSLALGGHDSHEPNICGCSNTTTIKTYDIPFAECKLNDTHPVPPAGHAPLCAAIYLFFLELEVLHRQVGEQANGSACTAVHAPMTGHSSSPASNERGHASRFIKQHNSVSEGGPSKPVSAKSRIRITAPTTADARAVSEEPPRAFVHPCP
ncbi:hypothetical protein TRVL_07550 [Trypanosoma vivax]|nr:hypothetical protein TRVL_07550 [Trypanosoma vivax]